MSVNVLLHSFPKVHAVVLAGRCVHLHPNPSPTALWEIKALFGSGLRLVVKRTFQLFPNVHAVVLAARLCPLADHHRFVV